MLRCKKFVLFAVILLSSAAGPAQAARLTLEKSHEELARNQSTTTAATTVSSVHLPIFREADHGKQGKSKGSKEVAALTAVKARLMKELKQVLQSESHKKGIMQVELEDDNIEEWNVKLFFPEDGIMHRGLAKLKQLGKEDHIKLHISFANCNYPNEAPFVRVTYPVLSGMTSGALCMSILTRHGWDPSFTCEAFILTLMTGLAERKVDEIEKLEKINDLYTEEKAREFFATIKRIHESRDEF